MSRDRYLAHVDLPENLMDARHTAEVVREPALMLPTEDLVILYRAELILSRWVKALEVASAQ